MSKVYAPDAKWHEMERGGIIPQAGNAEEYTVGGWRNEHPVRDDEACINCLFCWIYCPDTAVNIKDESVKGLGFSGSAPKSAPRTASRWPPAASSSPANPASRRRSEHGRASRS